MPELNIAAFDAYITELFAAEDDVLRHARADMLEAGLPSIAVSASEGRLLNLLVRLCGARRVLEIGTLGGYSAIWMGRALPPDGQLVSLEIDAHHAEVARKNVARAGLSDVVEVRVGPALDSLERMDVPVPFDVAFIDADKDGYADYLHAVLPLVRTGGLILGDNTLPDAILAGASETGTMRYNREVAKSTELESTIVPVLRSKGIDGLTVSIKSG